MIKLYFLFVLCLLISFATKAQGKSKESLNNIEQLNVLPISDGDIFEGSQSNNINNSSENIDDCAFIFDDDGFSSKNDNKDFVVYTKNGLTVSQLRSRILSKLTELFKSPKDVIKQISDNIIQINGYISDAYVSEGYSHDISFNLVIQLKDNKVRYNRPEISEIITKNVPFLGIAHLDMSKPITELVSKQDSRDELINKFNILIRDINKSLDTNDDW